MEHVSSCIPIVALVIQVKVLITPGAGAVEVVQDWSEHVKRTSI